MVYLEIQNTGTYGNSVQHYCSVSCTGKSPGCKLVSVMVTKYNNVTELFRAWKSKIKNRCTGQRYSLFLKRVKVDEIVEVDCHFETASLQSHPLSREPAVHVQFEEVALNHE